MRRLAFLFSIALCGWPQAAKEANRHYHCEEGREALIRGMGRAGRDAEQKPRELVASMGLKSGMTVADIGTGPGYMLPFLSQAVGPAGRVLAEDIFDDFLNKAREKTKAAGLANVTFVKGSENDPLLPAGEVDVALALDSYHHYDYPAEMLAGIRRALKPGGRLVIVEYHKSPDALPGGYAMQHVRLDRDGFTREIESHGFRLLSGKEHIPGKQYLLIFEPK